jgi:CRP-like cAMP-binding protein
VLAERQSAVGRALVSPDGLATEAVAMSAVVVHRFTLPEFRHLVERRPSVMLSVSRLLGLKQQQILIRLNRLLFRTSLGKVAGLLAELSERYGSETPTGRVLSFRLTHQEMASMIGVKRETVSECLAILECEGIIATRQRQITICRPAALDAIE